MITRLQPTKGKAFDSIIKNQHGLDTLVTVGRPSKLGKETLLDVALMVVDRDGKAATTADIAVTVRARVGPFYYHFVNREVLLLALRTHSIRRSQIDFPAAVGSSGGPGEALAAIAVTIPRYCCEHPGEARPLTLSRHEEVLARLEAGDDKFVACPGDPREVTRGFNDEVATVMADLTRQRFGSLEPLGLV